MDPVRDDLAGLRCKLLRSECLELRGEIDDPAVIVLPRAGIPPKRARHAFPELAEPLGGLGRRFRL